MPEIFDTSVEIPNTIDSLVGMPNTFDKKSARMSDNFGSLVEVLEIIDSFLRKPATFDSFVGAHKVFKGSAEMLGTLHSSEVFDSPLE